MWTQWPLCKSGPAPPTLRDVFPCNYSQLFPCFLSLFSLWQRNFFLKSFSFMALGSLVPQEHWCPKHVLSLLIGLSRPGGNKCPPHALEAPPLKITRSGCSVCRNCTEPVQGQYWSACIEITKNG